MFGTGATAQKACPTTGLTDKDGAAVVATTASTGSTGVEACYVGSDAYFADDKGVYHFKSNCSFDILEIGASEELCTESGGSWSEEFEGCEIPDWVWYELTSDMTEDDCMHIGGGMSMWEDERCICGWQFILSDGYLYCP